MKKSTKITLISVAAAAVILIAVVVIALARMGSVESNLYGLWEKEDEDGYTNSVTFGDDNSALLTYETGTVTQYQGTWEKGKTSSGVTEINLTLDVEGDIEMTLYMKRYHGKYVLLSEKDDMDSAFTKISDLSILDSTTQTAD